TDGLKAHLFTLNGAVAEWSAAWRDADGNVESTLLWTQEERPFGHFSNQVQGIERFIVSGKAPWPVERTLLVSGALDALLTSKIRGGQRIETPSLAISYTSDWNWQQPPPPPPGRPLTAP